MNQMMSRREWLKTIGIFSIATAGAWGGLFGGKAPALAQTRTVAVLNPSSYIPPADEVLKQHAEEFQKQSGVKVTHEFINLNDVQPRATAAIESGTGPDIILLAWNQPHLYGSGLANHNDIVEEMGGDHIYEFMRQSALVGEIYRGIPFYSVGSAYVYRKDIFQEVGITKLPDTMEEYLEVGKKLKNYGMPIGYTLGHTLGDSAFNNYPMLWSFGGQEVDEQQKVIINSPETRQALDFFKEFWLAACDESGLAWDDSSNNRAFLAETVAITLNAASIYFYARNFPDKVPAGLADKIGHFIAPKGPGGRFHNIQSYSYCVTEYSKNKEAAKDYLRFLLQKENYERWFVIQKGFALGPTPDWEEHPMWQEDPAMEPYRTLPRYGRNMGYAGPFDRKASEVQVKFIITDLFARVVKGETNENAIKWAEQELKLVYEKA